MDTLAQLVTNLLQALGFPPSEFFAPEDAVRAVKDSLIFYDVDLGQSNQHQSVSNKSFTPSASSRDCALTSVRGVPLWVERKVGTEPNEGWHFVGAANLAAVEDAWARGDERCAFYNEKEGLKVRLSYLSDGATAHRLWYDADPSLTVTLADPLRLPAKLYPMYTARAVLDAVPVILLNAAKDKGNEPSSLQITAWDVAGNRAEAVLRDYAPIWKQHRLGSRGAARGRNRRSVLARSGRDY